jgi:hypothetical protein
LFYHLPGSTAARSSEINTTGAGLILSSTFITPFCFGVFNAGAMFFHYILLEYNILLNKIDL